MVTLQELHGFIKSLSKAEKRFFKLLTATENSNIEKTIKLFDFLDKTKDAEEIDTKIKKQTRGILNAENVNQLYRLILSSQRNFYADSIPGFTLIDEVNNLKILFEKAQYKQCHKMLRSTKENALKLEKFGALMQLVEIEKHLLAQEMLNEASVKQFELLDEELIKYCELEKNIGAFYILYARINHRIKNGVAGEENYFREALSSQLLSDPETALCRKSRFLLHNCRAIASIALHDADSAFEELAKSRELMNENRLLFAEMPRQYIDVLFHSARLELIQNSSALAPSLNELERILDSGKMPAIDLNLKLRSYILLIRLQLNYNGRSISETESIADEILHFINVHESLINHEDATQLLFALTNYFIYTLSFTKARESHELLRKYTDKNNQEDIRNYSILQEYIIACETSNSAQISMIKPSLLKLVSNEFFKNDETEMIKILLGLPDITQTENTIASVVNEHLTKMSGDSFRNKLDLSYLNCINYFISKAGKNISIQSAFKTKQLSETNP